MFKKILVALDGSQLAEEVLPFAADVAHRFGSHITVATVVSESDRGSGLDRVFNAYLSNIVAGLKADKVNAAPSVLTGGPSDQILSHAERNGIEMIAITSVGKGGVGRWPLGSVAHKIITASSIPILLVPVGHGAKRKPGPLFTKVLLPVDVSELGEAALPCAEALTAGRDLSVTLLYVETTPYAPTRLSQKYYEETSEYLRQSARTYLDKTAAQLKQRGINAAFDIVTGDPAEKILDYAAKTNVDLIAISTHGRSGVARWALGSVAVKVLQESDLPLLLVRAPAMCPVRPA